MFFKKIRKRILHLELRVAELETKLSNLEQKQIATCNHTWIKGAQVKNDHFYDDTRGGGCSVKVYDTYQCIRCGSIKKMLVKEYEV